jgi:hypothetical protein
MKSFIASIAILALIGLGVGVAASAATESSVTATVTPQNISVSLNASSVNYGVLNLSVSNGSRTTAVSNTFTATNNSNVSANFGIRGTNTDNGWVLNSSPADVGTVGADQFVHRFDADATFTDGTAKALSTSNQNLGGPILVSGTQDFVLQMNMPTSSTDSTSVQSSTVTVIATAA